MNKHLTFKVLRVFLKRQLAYKGAFVLFFILGEITAQAQVLLAGTSFDPIAGNETRNYIGVNDIQFYGLIKGTFLTTPPLTPNVNTNTFHSTPYYAITNNPLKLDNVRFKDIANAPDYQLVFSPSTVASNLLEYKLIGLVPGSNVEVRVSYCSPISTTNTNCGVGQFVSLKGVINPDPFSGNMGMESTLTGMGQCATFSFTQTSVNSRVVDASGQAVIRINSSFIGTCQAVSITKIEVYGTPNPQLTVAGGNEFCLGEQVTIQTKQTYNGSYQWQVNEGNGWANVPGATFPTLLYELSMTTAKTYQFRAIITPSVSTPITSEAISVNAIVCCTQGVPPSAGSRQIIYQDNFGRLDLSDATGSKYFVWDYTDPANPKEVAKTTATPFRWQLTPAPLGATFVATGPPQDGSYTVASYLTSYNPYNGLNGARLEWAANVTGKVAAPAITYDHSGKIDGAALFLNCPPNTGGQVLYSRTISNLCFGKKVFFECWMAVFTNAASGAYNGVNVKVRLTDNGDATNVVEAVGTATREADGGGVWVKVASQINLVGTAVTMDIINNQNQSVNGNDLVVDDIVLRSCAPPSVEVFFDLVSYAKTDTLCEGPLTLQVPPTDLLENYYNNQAQYLFQYSKTPDILSSWKNVSNPQSASSLTTPVATLTGLAAGDKVYFRTVVATSAIFTAKSNFQGAANYANINDACRNYSVSFPVTAFYDGSVNCSFTTDLETGEKNKVLLLHPNPVKEILYLGEEVVSSRLFNSMGQQVLQGNSSTMNLSGLPVGVYNVSVVMKDGRTISQKIVKE